MISSILGLFLISFQLCFSLLDNSISLWLVWLVYTILPILILLSDQASALDFIVLICWLSILTFLTNDILLFYVFYESLVIPMIFLIGYFGSRQLRFRALIELLIYTIAGSLLLIIALLYLIISTGSRDIQLLSNLILSSNEQHFLFLLIFLGFSIKIPILPLHLWLPKAHVEAPTPVSIYLAAILLKIGIYGYIRLLLPIAPLAILYWNTLLTTIAIFGIIYTSIICLTLVDIKKIIAYSSIAHMNIAILGIFSNLPLGLESAFYF